MAVKLRLKRIGKTHRPFYRICAIDARRPRGGEYIESIGHYDPLVDDDSKKIKVDRERAEYWLGVGAQPSETVASFLRKLQVSGLSRPKKKPRKRPKATGRRKTSKSSKKRSRKKAKKTAAGSS